jgi:hypothetical protein
MLAVVLNGELKIQYDRAKELPEHQRLYLEKMDRKMDAGFELNGAAVSSPTPQDRARFVAGQLVQAMFAENEPLVAATLSYLAVRLPGLQQVKIQMNGSDAVTDLVFDEPYVAQSVVKFVDKSKMN